MKSGTQSWTQFILILFPVCLIFTSVHDLWAGETMVQVTHGDTGKRISCIILKDGESIRLSWTNSLFRLSVTETYIANDGMLVQTSVTFADPSGKEPPLVMPEDVNDLYHTGGSFRSEGLSRPFQRIVFRIGEIGNPVLKIRDHSIAFAHEAGFGGTVILESKKRLNNENQCPSGVKNSSNSKPKVDEES